MNYVCAVKKIFKLTFIAISFLLLANNSYINAGAGQVPMLTDEEYRSLSPSDQKQYENALKQQIEQMSPDEQEAYMQDMVQNMFDSLSPEQQKEVLEEAERIESMNEEDQQKYFKQVEKELEDVFGKEEKPVQEEPIALEAEVLPKVEPEVKERKIEAKISEQEKSIKEALNLLTEVATGIDSFMVKVEAKEDFMFKLSTWSKKNKIKSWNGTYKWNELKEKINLLRSQLDILKERDPKTKEYKHLLDLLEDKKLYDRIYGISIDLAEYEPIIRVASEKPLSKKIRKKSHKALRSLLNAFSDQFFPTDKDEPADLTLQLAELIKKFDPTAKKIKTEEEKLSARAIEESKRKKPGQLKVGGRAPRESGFGSRSEYYGQDDDFDWSQYDSNYDSSGSDYRSRQAERSQPSRTKTPKATPTKTTKPDKGFTAEDEEKYKKDRRFNSNYKALQKSLEEMEDNFDEHSKLKKPLEYFDKKNFDERFAKAMVSMDQLLNRATSKLERMQKRMKELSNSSQKAYTKDVKALFSDYKDSITEMTNALKLVGETPKGDDKMKWAHFGVKPLTKKGESISKDVQKIINKFENPTTVKELKNSAENFLNEAKKF